MLGEYSGSRTNVTKIYLFNKATMQRIIFGQNVAEFDTVFVKKNKESIKIMLG